MSEIKQSDYDRSGLEKGFTSPPIRRRNFRQQFTKRTNIRK